jgi:oxygen-independent coproporphyrinogen-3 oxidase
MAGIYIHIPFCRQKCYYCDFYKTLNTKNTGSFLSSLKEEVKLRQNYLENETIKTIYFGGGTPSVLSKFQIHDILFFLQQQFQISETAEITFEANPDDLTPEYLNALFNIGINRLSVGIQSFENDLLKKMNRRHNAGEAILSIENSVKAGFENISIDFIYGLPGLSQKQWKQNLQQAFKLPVHHLSAYHLTYHEGTPFYTWLKKGTLKALEEKESVQQFSDLLDLAEKNNFEGYEISNFAKNGMYSKHNKSYWTGEKYLGLGPSAHSFNQKSRQWNMASVDGYIKAIQQNLLFYQHEELTDNERFNEYILTRIRTKWGVNLKELKSIFGETAYQHFLTNIKKHVDFENGYFKNNVFLLSKKGLFVSDDIMSDLMII